MKKYSPDELERCSIDEFKKKKKKPYVIVLDNIRSLMNVGSAFRTADAFLAEKIYLGGITGKPPHREIQKTALGSTESVEWEYEKETIPLLEKLKVQKYTLVGIEQTDESIPLQTFKPKPNLKYAFIFGNEVNGIEEKILPLLDHCIEIPQYGTKHSLNISVAVGIVIWDFLSKLPHD